MGENSDLDSIKNRLKLDKIELDRQLKKSDSLPNKSLYESELIFPESQEKDNFILPNLLIRKVINTRKMADIKEILELYDVDKITKNIAPFDGNKTDLIRFIETVTQTLKVCEKIEKTDYYKIIIANIRNKIVGSASNSLTTHNISHNNWNDIKSHLIEKYADSRDESNLQLELYSLIKCNLAPEILYTKIQSILTLLASQVKLNIENDEIIKHQILNYQKLGLTIYQAALKEPLGSRVRASNPKDINEARDIVIKEDNIQKLKQSYSNQNNSKSHWNLRNQHQTNSNQTNSFKTEDGSFKSNFKPRNNFNGNKPKYNNYNNNYSKKEEVLEDVDKNKYHNRNIKKEHYNIETKIDDENF